MQTVNADATVTGLFMQPGCTNMDNKKIEDGRMSFPSGHSSCSMAVGLFAALYMLWTLHWREGGALHSTLMRPASTFVGRITKDVVSLVVLLVLLFQIAWPWGVALSRFIDNRHNPSDIVGGLLLAVSFVPVFVARMASSVSYQAVADEWSSQEQQELEQREQEQQLLQQEQEQQSQVVIEPLPETVLPKQHVVGKPAQEHVLPKHAAHQQQLPIFAAPKPAAEQNEVQLTIQGGASPQASDASSAVACGRQAASELGGQALPGAVAGGAGSV